MSGFGVGALRGGGAPSCAMAGSCRTQRPPARWRRGTSKSGLRTGRCGPRWVWDDPPGVPNVGRADDDLDLRAVSPGGDIAYPWTLDGLDTVPAGSCSAPDRINVQQMEVDASAAGTWRIEVVGHAVCAAGRSPLACASPPVYCHWKTATRTASPTRRTSPREPTPTATPTRRPTSVT